MILYARIFAFLLLIASMFSSCNRFQLVSEEDYVSDVIAFSLSGVSTKGTPVSELDEFYVKAYFSGGEMFLDWYNVDASSQTTVYGQTLFETKYYWPVTPLDFLATNIENGVDFSYVDGHWQGSFEYTLPGPESAKNDAENQKDYLFAIAEAESKDANNGIVQLDFSHCFAAVNFKIASGFDNWEGRQVKEVCVYNVPSSGKCTFGPVEDGLEFIWDVSAAEYQTYCQAIPYEGNVTNIPNDCLINSGDLTFMLIPHTLSDDARFRVTIAINQHREPQYQDVITIERSLNEITDKWEAGKKYTYVLKSN